MVESGLILKWYKDHMPTESKCDKSLSSVRHKQAKLKTTKGAFVALFIGIMTATITILLEICIAILKRKLAAKQLVAGRSFAIIYSSDRGETVCVLGDSIITYDCIFTCKISTNK